MNLSAFKEKISTTQPHGFTSPYRFNGKELGQESGLYYYGARYYNPTLSVWLVVDPLADKFPSLSSYVFTNNNPTMLVDPDGKAPTGGGVVFGVGLRAGIGSKGKFSSHFNLSVGYHTSTSGFSGLAYASASVYSGNNLGNSYQSFANADFSAGLYGSFGSGSAGAHPIYGLNYDNPLPISNTFEKSFGMGVAGTYNYGINSKPGAPGAQINTNFNIRTGSDFSLNTSNDGYLDILASSIGIEGVKNVDAGHTGALSLHAGSKGQFSAGYQQFTGTPKGGIQKGYRNSYPQYGSQMSYNRANTFIGLNGFRMEYSGEPYLQNSLHNLLDNKKFITPTWNTNILNTSYGL